MSERKHYSDHITPGVDPAQGLICPNPDCGCRHFSVVETRAVARGIRRRRECRHCGEHITTFERAK